MTTRSCRSCSLEKPAAEFRGRRPDCRVCERKTCREYSASNRAKRNARLARWRRANPAAAVAVDRRKRLRKYGLTEAERTAMKQAQHDVCLLCRRPKPLSIDHCHATGRVRGLLCAACNTLVGWAEANPDVIERARIYLGDPCHADVLLELANVPICEEVPCPSSTTPT